MNIYTCWLPVVIGLGDGTAVVQLHLMLCIGASFHVMKSQTHNSLLSTSRAKSITSQQQYTCCLAAHTENVQAAYQCTETEWFSDMNTTEGSIPTPLTATWEAL